jgi:uncharacterized membrane protein YoaK (UPF0700 family)
MADKKNDRDLTKTAVAAVLTFVAGYVDAVGWLSLNRVFTAQMSGNAILLAVHIAAGEGGHAWLQADTLAAFFMGLVLSGSVIEIGMRQRRRRIFVVALAVEFVMLAVFAGAGGALLSPGSSETSQPSAAVYALVAVVAFAMGSQNTSLKMAGILSVFTTHVTGAISGLSEEIIVCGFSLLQPRNRRKAHGGFVNESLRSSHRKAFKNIGQSAALLIGFFLGALAAAALVRPAGVGAAMLVPLAMLIGVGVFDWVVPLTAFPSTVEQE